MLFRFSFTEFNVYREDIRGMFKNGELDRKDIKALCGSIPSVDFEELFAQASDTG